MAADAAKLQQAPVLTRYTGGGGDAHTAPPYIYISGATGQLQPVLITYELSSYFTISTVFFWRVKGKHREAFTLQHSWLSVQQH